jgi:hypothetical protein
MSVAQVSVAEERRVAALHELRILDTQPEQRFDRVTRLAQHIFAVPMVSVTLVDSDRYWLKSAQGPLPPGGSRNDLLCELTIRQNETLVIGDTTKDDRVSSNTYVVGDPRLRFYAGHPLFAPGGEPIGTLCIMDVRPRSLSEVERASLEDLAGWVQNELVRDQELESARAVQRSLLPKGTPDIAGYEVAGLCLQAFGVGGDFYDWCRTRGGQWQFTISDVMGKGMGAALIAATTRALLRGAAGAELSEGFSTAASLLSQDLAESGSFVTTIHGRLDPAASDISYIDAGHGLALLVRADRSTTHLASRSLPVGIEDGERWFSQQIHLEPGDSFICGSDGLFDIFEDVPAGIRAVAEASTSGAEAMLEVVRNQAGGRYLTDDVSALVLRRTP